MSCEKIYQAEYGSRVYRLLQEKTWNGKQRDLNDCRYFVEMQEVDLLGGERWVTVCDFDPDSYTHWQQDISGQADPKVLCFLVQAVLECKQIAQIVTRATQ